jgi:hypothetical protein
LRLNISNALPVNDTFLSYDYHWLQQLQDDVNTRFPVVLTRKFTADQSIAGLLRTRIIGNSPTALCNDVHELHTEKWMHNTVECLSDCKRHKTDRERMKQLSCTYDSPPELKNPPKPKWFLAIYVRDGASAVEDWPYTSVRINPKNQLYQKGRKKTSRKSYWSFLGVRTSAMSVEKSSCQFLRCWRA